MYFCPECSFSLDISKTSGIEEDTRKELEKPKDAIKRLDKDLTKYKPKFSKSKLLSDKGFQKLNDEEKQRLEALFSFSLSNAEFKCQNCGYNDIIKETISLYSLDNNENIKINTIEDNKIISADKTLPRTKDYNCKNLECSTHKNPNDKEAVFYRENNNYQINYICTKCFFGWKI